jgi:hypothetical protein
MNARPLLAPAVAALIALGCGSGSENDDIEGSCLPPGGRRPPLDCSFNCKCGTGGKCQDAVCVSCHCNSDEYCDGAGKCEMRQAKLWYSDAIEAGSR